MLSSHTWGPRAECAPRAAGEPGTHLQQDGQQEAQVHLVEAHLAHRLERLLHLHGGRGTENLAATALELETWLGVGRGWGTGTEDWAGRGRRADRRGRGPRLGRTQAEAIQRADPGVEDPAGLRLRPKRDPAADHVPGRSEDARLLAPAQPPRFLSEVTGIFGERLAGAPKGKRKWVRRGRPRGLTGGAGSSSPRPSGFAPSHKAVECGGARSSRAFGGEGQRHLSSSRVVQLSVQGQM